MKRKQSFAFSKKKHTHNISTTTSTEVKTPVNFQQKEKKIADKIYKQLES